MHIGSQLTDTQPFAEGAGRLVDLVHAVRADGTTTLRELDVGGGLGIRYHEETPISPRDFAAALMPIVKPTGLTLYLEPGRFLVGASGVLLTRVLFRKHSGGKEFVIVDAGMNDLERPSRYQAYHAIVPVAAARRGAARGRHGGAGLRDGRLLRPRSRPGPGGAGRPGGHPLRRRLRLRDGLQLQHEAAAARGDHRRGPRLAVASAAGGGGPLQQ